MTRFVCVCVQTMTWFVCVCAHTMTWFVCVCAHTITWFVCVCVCADNRSAQHKDCSAGAGSERQGGACCEQLRLLQRRSGCQGWMIAALP